MKIAFIALFLLVSSSVLASDLVTPALQAADAATAIAAVRQMESQADLSRVAWESRWKGARMEAIARMTDQSLLAEIATKGDWYLRWCSLPQLKPDLLARVATTDPDAYVREDAVKLLKDTAVLKQVLDSDRDERVRQAAAYTIKDQPLLAHVALQDPDPEVRVVALGGLKNRDLLLQVATHTKEPEARRRALMLINDQKTLARVAAGGPGKELRLDAITLLQDQPALKALAQDSRESADIRAAAAASITEETVLGALAAAGQPREVRLAALNATGNQDLIRQLALSDRDPTVRLAATGRLEDAGALARLAQEEPDEKLRARAASRLNDPALLGRIALKDRSTAVRREAVARVRDAAVLEQAIGDPDGQVRARAVLGLPDRQPVFERLAVSDPDPEVRKNAAARVSSPALLAKIIRTDKNESVRMAALTRTTDPSIQAAYLSDGADWRLRCQLALAVSDRAVLERTASADPDQDVRHCAWVRIYDLKLWDMLSDASLAETIRKYNEDPVGQPDSREERLRQDLSDPAVKKQLGALRLQVGRHASERRFALENADGGYPPLRGTVFIEEWKATVKDSRGRVLSDHTYRGRNPGKAFAFDQSRPPVDRAYRKYNNATVDYVAICRDILQKLSSDQLTALSRSPNKDISTAAQILLNP